MASFGTRTIAGNAFTIQSLLVRRTYSDTSSIVLQEMLGTIPDTSGSISVLSIGILFPLVFDWVVTLHRRTFLLANPVIVKIPACQAI